VLIALGFSIFHLYKQKFQNELQADFINNITHEFQTPLTTLTLGLDHISKPTIINQPEKLQKYTHLMQGQVAYLKQHLDNLMHVIKAESLGVLINKKPINPNVLIEKVIVQLTAIIEEKKVIFRFLLNEENATIYADESNLYMAILNVISNAIKYAPDPIITITTTLHNQDYTIMVKDNGIGIEQQVLSSLFKKFYRVPTGNIHNVKGLGLGLYFVKKIIDEHGGKIHIQSTPNIGTEFKITLPK
jgi:two-component system, OmpR family, phosphate regulon sensor histidine kinase PhoR